MPITAIITQPGSASLPTVYAAYRPIRFVIGAQATDGSRLPPRVYCDIYFNGTFYKTLSATQYKAITDTTTDWEFDISGSAQEYLSFNLPANGGTVIELAPLVILTAFCRFRSSGYDFNGFLQPEGILPVQATGSKFAVAGTGTESESFQIINAVLQHEDNQNLQQHLQYARPNGSWEANTYPLTHRPNGYKVCKTDSDHYPFLHLGDKIFAKIQVVRTNKNGTTTTGTYTVPQTCASVVSNVVATVLFGNDVLVTFDSSGPATIWEWTITGGTIWTTINTKSFIITLEDLLIIIITEAGEPILTENGEFILPEGVSPFDDYTITIRPRCPNGVYGTSGSDTFTLAEAPVCPVSLFLYSSQSYTNHTITFVLGLPFGENDIELEWKFDYGNGVVSTSSVIEYTDVFHPFIWNAPVMADNGTYRVRIRTKCGTDDYSSFSSWVNVAWNKPVIQVSVSILSILESGGSWRITCELSQAVSDDLIIRGFFMGDGPFGVQSYNFTCLIAAGLTQGITTVAGAAPGGASFSRTIQAVHPNPTSAGETLLY